MDSTRRRPASRAVLKWLIVLAAGTCLGPAVATAQADISGTWSCCGAGGAGGQVWMISQSGSSLSGTASYPGGGQFATITGSASGSSASITTTYSAPAGYVATFTGTVGANGATMSGSWQSNAHQSGTWTAMLTSGPPKRASATGVICNLDYATGLDTCGAAVADASGESSPIAPTGSVTFSSASGGSFLGTACVLQRTLGTAGISSCTLQYRPPDTSTAPSITATYGGSSEFAGSSGNTTTLPGKDASSTPENDCIDGCDNSDVDFAPTIDPGQTDENVNAGCGSSAAVDVGVAAGSAGGCAVDSSLGTPADMQSALDTLTQVTKTQLQVLMNAINGGGGPSPGIPALDQPQDTNAQTLQQQIQIQQQIQQQLQDTLKQAIQNTQASNLQNADTALAGDFSADSGAAAADAATAAASPSVNVVAVLNSVDATHPTSAEISAFKQCLALATSPVYSPERAVARIALWVAVVLGRRAIARDLHLKSFKQVGKGKTAVLGSLNAFVKKGKHKALTIRVSTIGGRILRLLMIAGYRSKTTITLKITETTKGKRGTHTIRKTLRVI